MAAKQVRRALVAPLAWAPVVPFALVAGVLLLGAGVWLVVQSFRDVDGGFSLQAWRDVLGTDVNRQAIRNSILLSVVVATIASAVGTPLSWYFAHLSRRGTAWAMALMNVAANFGGASLAVAFVATLGSVGFLRLLSQDLLGADLPVDPFGFWGFVLLFLYFMVPLYVLIVTPGMGALRPEWFEAAQTAAATRPRFWRSVGVPVLAPFVLAGWVLIFAWSVGQFSVVYALVGSESKVPVITLRIGSYLFTALSGTNRFQRASVLAVLLIAVAASALGVYRAISRRWLRRLEAGAA
jgi:ABC-type uncharacterized transport system permease subunit